MIRVFLKGQTDGGAEVRATVEGSTRVEVLARLALFVSVNPRTTWEVIE